MTATNNGSANYSSKINTREFSQLPLDIHTLILHILSPLDIFRLRKTCKAMLDATSQRIVWLKALERMCNDNTVYPYSFPTDKLTLLELEYAVMAPQKWEHLALSHQEEEMPSFATYTLQPQYHPNARRSHHQLERLYLIPGGRFLILVQRGYLTLWDLGYISAIGAFRRTKIKPIAQIPCACGSYAVHSSPDKSALRIFTITRKCEHDGQPMRYQFEVIEIFPWKYSPEFTTIATLSVISEHNLDFTSICGDRLTLVYGPILKIWDFKSDEWATWNTSDSQRQIIMNNNHIALIGRHNISVWDFPKLSKGAQMQATKAEPSIPLAPQRILTFEENSIPVDDFSCSGLCDWYTDSPQPLWFDIVDELGILGESLKLTRFEADISDSTTFPLVPIRSFNLRVPTSDDPYLGAYRVCGSNIVIPRSTSLEISCHLGASSRSANTRDHNTTLRLIQGVAWNHVSLCPVSGRLAYIAPESDDIEIIDFLPPLSDKH
ncbi:hypothetical protein GALMADRAFT_252689 [Galerina marginata CBS 339.88]|uniref:F-box domain-containing protein n=1 Tax=Galerina marginata (strain CBS 339.88) TaxID=685588 RepID=A0A067SY02_GALM3|nr:hypothetical protein GALMADRAFT_252689 [Galerina marginata CBS 339.88]